MERIKELKNENIEDQSTFIELQQKVLKKKN